MSTNRNKYRVYVIEMDPDALADKDRPEPGKTVVYVGYTSLDPAARLAKHHGGVRPAARVFRRMKDASRSWLRDDLAHYPGPYETLNEALRNEKRTHNRLLSDGYVVFGDKGIPIGRALERSALSRRGGADSRSTAKTSRETRSETTSENAIGGDGAYLFQFNRESVEALLVDVDKGVESWWVNIDRNHQEMDLDDPVFVWVSEPAEQAGIVALGVATGEFDELEHPASYHDPDGPRELRTSTEIFWEWVDIEPVVTRAEMKDMPLFADFELFEMPNQKNAFLLSPAQAEFVMQRITAVVGE